MIGLTHTRRNSRRAAITAALLLTYVMAAGCASSPPPEPEVAAAPPPPPPPPLPPPVDLAGRWRFTAVGAGACFMKFGAEPGAAQGTIAPEGGCPGRYFTSRKWTFEHDLLTIRNHKDEPLAQLSFANGRFQGHEGNVALGLTR